MFSVYCKGLKSYTLPLTKYRRFPIHTGPEVLHWLIYLVGGRGSFSYFCQKPARVTFWFFFWIGKRAGIRNCFQPTWTLSLYFVSFLSEMWHVKQEEIIFIRWMSPPLSQSLAKHLSLKTDEKSYHLCNETSAIQTMSKRLTEPGSRFINRSSLLRWWEFIQWDLALKVNFMWGITHRLGRGAL